MSLLDRKRFGLVLRGFSKSSDQVAKNVIQLRAAITKASSLVIGGKKVFSEILVLIASDPNYPDCDCGETAAALRQSTDASQNIEIAEVKHGDLFCGALNYGVMRLARKRIDYVTIMSHGVADYLSMPVMEQTFEAFELGALVVGVAINELSQSIFEGRLANTFTTYDVPALGSVGLFDLRASQPRKNDPTTEYLRGWNVDKGDVYYPRAGVEEIIPLLRLVRMYGPCIAPIQPFGSPEWKIPDPVQDLEGFKREIAKMGTKLQRQAAHAAFEGCSLDVLKGGVMEHYRRF
jgi:hypothetical protein